MKSNSDRLLKKIRWLVAFLIFGLVVSGVTAFPLELELRILGSIASGIDPEASSGLTQWILKVRDGLIETYAKFPFIGYGTDWLAFGHIVIALFFIPVWKDPVRYAGIFWVGVASCVLVWPLAFICGAIRGIPFFWRLIDCSFGVVALIPLGLAIFWTRRLARVQQGDASPETP